jgi:Flp pilus assembly protein TadD
VAEHPSPLDSLGWISVEQTSQRRIGDFDLDPAIPLPVDLAPGESAEAAAGARRQAAEREISPEAIVSGMLKVLVYDPANPHADYYRRFVLAVRPEIRSEFTGAGIMTARNGKHELAIEVFRALEALFPEDAVTAMNLALVYDERSRVLERTEVEGAAEEVRGLAFEAYKRALAIDPSEPSIHYNLAIFYLHQQSFEKAREHFEAFARLSDDERRIREARRIIREIDDQGLADDLFRRSYDAIRMGREEEGVEGARSFIEGHPGVWKAWFLLGWGLRRLRRWEEARQAFLRAIELGGEQADALNELAICLMELGELAQSERMLRRALAVEPENVKVICNLGIVAERQGRREEALGYFRSALEIDPADPIADRWLRELGGAS